MCSSVYVSFAQERARAGGSPAQVEGNGNADDRDSDDLESVPEPPAEVPPAEKQGSRERAGEPDDADGDDEVAPPAGETERAESAPEEQREERHARDEHNERKRAARLGHGRNEARLEQSGDPEREDETDGDREQAEERSYRRRPAQRRNDAERENGSADWQRRTARERDDAVHPDEDAGRGEPVQAEKRGHHRERAPHEDRVAVALTRPRDRQRDGRGSRDACAERDACKVDPAVHVHRLPAEKVEQGDGRHGHERGHAEHRNLSVHHPPCIGSAIGA